MIIGLHKLYRRYIYIHMQLDQSDGHITGGYLFGTVHMNRKSFTADMQPGHIYISHIFCL